MNNIRDKWNIMYKKNYHCYFTQVKTSLIGVWLVLFES